MQELKTYFNLWLPSPLQKMEMVAPYAEDKQIYIKRDDLIHHHISGNKFRKLKYNWEAFRKGDYNEIVAFGGAFSNLLYTLSYIAKGSKVPMTFYVRGDGYDPLNPTLRSIQKNGVDIRFLNRSDFRKKEDPEFMNVLQKEHPKAYFVPEGGSNKEAIPGSAEIVKEIRSQLGADPDYLLMDLGTAGTFSGVLAELPEKTKLVGIPVLKGVDWRNTILKVNDCLHTEDLNKNFEIVEDYHFGGFAKYNMELIEFINDFSLNYGIPLDPIYTGKLGFALFDLLKNNYFKKNSTIVWVHAGGIQGIAGFNYINGQLVNQ